MGFMEVVLVAVPGMMEQRDSAPGVYWPDGEVSVSDWLVCISKACHQLSPLLPLRIGFWGAGQSFLSQKSLRWQNIAIHKK